MLPEEIVYLKTINDLIDDKDILVKSLFEIMTMAHKKGQRDIYEISNEAIKKLKNPTFSKIKSAI